MTAPPYGETANPVPKPAVRMSATVNVDLVADHLRALSARPDPIHLLSIAQRLGVHRVVVDEKLDRDGQVSWTQGASTIYLRGGLSPTRRRFTLCHELAHVLLNHGNPQCTDAAPSPETIRSEEQLADAIAGATLVSPAVVQRLLDLPEIGLSDIREAAEDQQVSKSVIVNRLMRRNQTALLLDLRRHEHSAGWRAYRLASGAPHLPKSFGIPRDQNGVIASWSTEDQPVRFHALIGDCPYLMEGTGNLRSNRALVLVTYLRPDRSERALNITP